MAPGDYMLPVKVMDVSQFEVSESKAVYPLAIRVMGHNLDRTGWTAEANSEEVSGEGAGNGVAGCALDGNLTTFWHSNGMVAAITCRLNLLSMLKRIYFHPVCYDAETA